MILCAMCLSGYTTTGQHAPHKRPLFQRLGREGMNPPSLARPGETKRSFPAHVVSCLTFQKLFQQIPTGQMCAEYRVKTSCPSCGTVKRVYSSYRPCRDAVHRGVGVCKRVGGSSVGLKWLCGKPKCEELADIRWEEECQSRTLGVDQTRSAALERG